MRRKTPKAVITFASTADALALEEGAQRLGIPGRIIPVPSAISAGCGMAWCVSAEQRQDLLGAIEAHGLSYEGIYEVDMY